MTFRNGLMAAVVLLSFSTTALTAQPDPAARALVARALDHMGGEALVRGLRTLQYNTASANHAAGQEPAVGDPLPLQVRNSTVRLDFERIRFSLTQEIPFIGPNGGSFRQNFVQTPQGSMQNNNGNLLAPPAPPAAGPVQIRFFPSRLLLTAIEPATRLERADGRRGTPGSGVRMTTALDTATLWFDAEGRFAFTEVVTDDPILGDRVTRTSYHAWALVGREGLRLPQRIEISTNGRVTTSNSYAFMTPNPDLADSLFWVPDSIATRSRALAANPAIGVRLDSLAPGVFHVTGGSHSSLAVVQADSIVLFELPLTTQRIRAVLDTLASRFPRTPVRLAGATHDHWDHAGGVRAALAARLPVYAHINTVAGLRAIASARRTRVPDGVERLRNDLRAVGDSLTIGSGANRLVLYHLPNAHDDGSLVAYLPEHRILFVADVIPNGGFGPNREVADFARTRGLDIQRVAPSHGAPFPFTQVTQLAQ